MVPLPRDLGVCILQCFRELQKIALEFFSSRLVALSLPIVPENRFKEVEWSAIAMVKGRISTKASLAPLSRWLVSKQKCSLALMMPTLQPCLL